MESIITRHMVISGIVECQGRVVLEGVVEGSFSGGTLEIMETGRISGDIKAKAIDCRGRMEGNVVTEMFALRKSGFHVGTVETQKLIVDPGAIIDCVLQSGASKESTATAAHPVTPRRALPYNLSTRQRAFDEDCRPCCMDVPWSERLEMYSHLLDLLEKNKQLIKVTGEQGSGKSVLVDKLKKSLPSSYEVILINDQIGSVAAMLLAVAADLTISGELPAAQSDLVALIKNVLDDKRHQGRRVVLLVDDAEKMYPATMEGLIRLLTNAYGGGPEMMQMILLGTKEMEKNMVATTQEYFEDETNCQLYLKPLSVKDTADYLRLCLQLAASGESSFSTAILPYQTIRTIQAMSHGNIAEINRIAKKALKKALAAGSSEISTSFL